jgi:diaminopimelate decarboxylase
VGEAGAFLTRVQYVKKGGPKTFVIVDGGMSELIRPSHYGGYHAIEPAGPIAGREEVIVDVVGPVCETGDFLALDRPVPAPREGELLAVHTSGAYGFSMASNYNGRLRPAEVLVDGTDVRVVRRRETYQDLIRGEA